MRESPWTEEWEEAALRRPRRWRPWVNLVLFLVTIVTTIGVGGSGIGRVLFSEPFRLRNGIAFSGTLLLILSAHELGHYFMARRWFMRVSLPYFIPFPAVLGTLGAFIKLRSPVPDRRALLDIGAWGPLAGFVVTLPAIAVGLGYSRVLPPMDLTGGLVFGEPLIFTFLTKLVLGVAGEDVTIVLHPIAQAGWLGLFVTALNLLPIGQLDGGHILYALVGRIPRGIALGVLAALLLLGFFLWPGWYLWAGIMFLIGFRHPPLLDEAVPLDRRRRILGWCCVGVFILSFTPAPFTIP